MTERANQLISDILRRVHEAIAENDITYDEFQIAKQWFIDVGEAGEWPLFGDVYIEHVVEEQAFGNRAGSQGTILGPFHVPGSPVLVGETDSRFDLDVRHGVALSGGGGFVACEVPPKSAVARHHALPGPGLGRRSADPHRRGSAFRLAAGGGGEI